MTNEAAPTEKPKKHRRTTEEHKLYLQAKIKALEVKQEQAIKAALECSAVEVGKLAVLRPGDKNISTAAQLLTASAAAIKTILTT